jgi:DNA-binding transcriptional MocR family regulator
VPPSGSPADLPIIQSAGAGDRFDLERGHPAAALLPAAGWAAAMDAVLTRFGWQALTYGYELGPGPLVEWLAGRLGRIDGRAPEPGEVFISAGASQALDLVCAALTRPGDVVLVDSPTYHLALRIIADHGVEIVGAPADADGIDPAATAGLLGRLRAAGRRVPLLYLVPTFANPTGGCLPADRRAALVAVAGRAGTMLVEDDTYRELAYAAPPPVSLWSLAGGDGVLRIGSFSKTVAPGLRLGFLTGPRSFVRTLGNRGMVDSGGGVNHTTAVAMAGFGDSGGYDQHLDRIRDAYRARRDALTAALRTQLPAVPFRPPAGGWFVWLQLPDWAPAARLLPRAEEHGVSFLPGARCYVTTAGTHQIRLSFSAFDPPQLAAAAGRLAAALTDLAADSPTRA